MSKRKKLEIDPWSSQRPNGEIGLIPDDQLNDVADMAITDDPWKVIEQYINFGNQIGPHGYSSGKPWSATHATKTRRSLERLRKSFPKGRHQATPAALKVTFGEMSSKMSRATLCGHASCFRSMFKWAAVAKGDKNPMAGWGEPSGIRRIWMTSRMLNQHV